ncbi:hypothetical protein TraAM80_06315 [Trypanosoma rangeli]|uniref:Uncharacterized protein n=1 Tax=Trypanosoma rangeli TaxID=5698 RepID=A0A422NB00_TRYRA|nr:uncharacterized protein TraAM80_06315 [Trypanosoma rangeli]RNF02633.1 hypothetical protein TraAM80_06315 [Trypanosoma rangeli]|eukprot:RNF02633.1 hypothetical protein TraAM80_06315 [Trypanosoma rangeli]
MRRTASHAKIVQQHERRKASREAKASSARFSSKQSRFQLRQEEMYAQEALQPVTASLLPASRHCGGRPPAETTSTQSPATFSRFERPLAAGEAGSSVGTTATATFGLAPSRRAGMHVADSRSARRAARFRLEENGQSSALPSLGEGLLGATRHAREEASTAPEADSRDDNGEPQRKKTREERFREVLASSKEHRAQAQREREERAQQTTALDAAFSGVMHLLERRDKTQEEREAFARAGTPQVRALLQSFRENHVAKVVSLRSDGSFTVAPLANRGTAVSEIAAAPVLDEASIALLQKVRAEANAQERSAPSALPLNPLKDKAVTVGAEKSNLTGEGGGDEDDFDRMMHAMRGETRRAHAGERTLTAEEEQAVRDQQALLETDRGVVPLLAPDAAQLTRAEWLSRGGDRAYLMQGGSDNEEEDDTGEAEDALDISSAYDSDEAPSIEEAVQETEEEDDEAGEKRRGADAAAGATGCLEEFVSAMEALSREADGALTSRAARSRAYHAVLRRLHQYAREHVCTPRKRFAFFLLRCSAVSCGTAHSTVPRFCFCTPPPASSP